MAFAQCRRTDVRKSIDRRVDAGANGSVAMPWTPPPNVKLKELKVYGLVALAATIRLGVVGNLLAVVQGVDPRILYRRNVNEGVRTPIVRSDEAEPFVGVEEFNSASSHECLSVTTANVRQTHNGMILGSDTNCGLNPS